MSHEEDAAVVAHTIKVVGGRVPVIVGSGSNCTATQIEKSIQYQNMGADALLLISPYYNKANIVGIKEASGDMSYAMKIARCVGPDFALYSGNDDITVPLMSIGGSGVISVYANVMPAMCHQIVDDYLHGRQDQAVANHLKYLQLMNDLFLEVNPIPVKTAMNLLGLNVAPVRDERGKCGGAAGHHGGGRTAVKILLIGRGKMGKLIRETAESTGDEVVAALGHDDLARLGSMNRVADVVIDFSRPEALDAVCEYVRRTGMPLVSGTTGYTPEQKQRLEALGSAAPVLWSANYSLGVAVFVRALQAVSDVLKPDFDIEITETHHNQKADAPSGTAKLLLEAIDPQHALTPVYGREGICGPRNRSEVGIHALRGGTVAGTHTVHFFGTDEEFSITHRAASRQIFVSGALHMARLLTGKPAGVYDLQKILFGE